MKSPYLSSLMAMVVLTLSLGVGGSMAENNQEVTTPSGLKYVDQVVGTGEVAVVGKTANVHYTGWLENGKSLIAPSIAGSPSHFRLVPGASSRVGMKGFRG